MALAADELPGGRRATGQIISYGHLNSSGQAAAALLHAGLADEALWPASGILLDRRSHSRGHAGTGV